MSTSHDAPSTNFRVVETASGALRGAVGAGIASFRGIHYGGPTSGKNRFLPPRPVEAWAGVRDALVLGPQSPQMMTDLPVWLDSTIEGEDCLVLNVWAPDHAGPASDLPVMVWLHGGGFAYGSAGAGMYDGSNIALNGDVVVVGVNHRLNAFGYTYLGGGVDERFAMSGNVGQLDLVAALQWVAQNIGAFGGDAQNVTIFGQSGGGGKVMTLMAMEEAKGLFHKAIVMSGAPQRFLTPEHGDKVTARLFNDLGLRKGDVDALQDVPTEQLVRVVRAWADKPLAPDEMTRALEFGPLIDGRVLTSQAWVDGAPELSREVPLMIGSTLHETVSYIGPVPGELSRRPSDDRDFARLLATYSVVTKSRADELVPLIRTYRQAMPSLSQDELLVRISTDIGFWSCAVQVASQKADQGGAAVFAYECAWTTPCFGGRWAPHGVDLPFVFNQQEYGAAWDGEDSDAARAAADPDGRRYRVGSQMFDAWTAFARTGNPSTETQDWPAYDTKSRATLVFDSPANVVHDNRGELRQHVTALTAD